MAKLATAIPFGVLVGLWFLVSLIYGEQLVPAPSSVMLEGLRLMSEIKNWEEISITLFRGVVGVTISFVIGFVIAVPCGFSQNAMKILSPFIVASQGCPPIIWISLLMVWAGMSSVVPLAVVIITLVPVVFFNIAQGVASLEEHLFSMAKLYHVSRPRMVIDILLPGIRPYVFSSLSYSLSVAWKVTATAEFLGSSSGIGSRLYWAYRYLDMTQLFFWSLVLILIGFSIEMLIIQPLREYRKTPWVSSK